MKPFLETIMSHIKARLREAAAAAQAAVGGRGCVLFSSTWCLTSC
jgi:hypothetical protein